MHESGRVVATQVGGWRTRQGFRKSTYPLRHLFPACGSATSRLSRYVETSGMLIGEKRRNTMHLYTFSYDLESVRSRVNERRLCARRVYLYFPLPHRPSALSWIARKKEPLENDGLAAIYTHDDSLNHSHEHTKRNHTHVYTQSADLDPPSFYISYAQLRFVQYVICYSQIVLNYRLSPAITTGPFDNRRRRPFDDILRDNLRDLRHRGTPMRTGRRSGESLVQNLLNILTRESTLSF